MAETSLTQDQGRALLQKLAQDDSFRALFETAPAKALSVLGVDAETIVHLPPKCLCPNPLAPRNHYGDLLKTDADEMITSAMAMFVPMVGVKNS